MAINGVDWFQVGTDRPEAAEAFYGEVFGWTFTDDGTGYRLITTPGRSGPSGGLTRTDQQHAVFFVTVADTADACRRIEAAGGKVLVAPTDNDGLTFAHVLDPAGNRFGVFTPH